MPKAKFRDDVRSRTDVAIVNEALCKFVAHNLCCLIMSQFELGIGQIFWGEEPQEVVQAEVIETEAVQTVAPVQEPVSEPVAVESPLGCVGA